jgi:hypothetical protein
MIIRAPKPVVLISRALLEDEFLTWGARGLMAYIEAMPDDWKFDRMDLVNACGDAYAPHHSNYKVIDALVDELLAAGYLEQR